MMKQWNAKEILPMKRILNHRNSQPFYQSNTTSVSTSNSLTSSTLSSSSSSSSSLLSSSLSSYLRRNVSSLSSPWYFKSTMLGGFRFATMYGYVIGKEEKSGNVKRNVSGRQSGIQMAINRNYSSTHMDQKNRFEWNKNKSTTFVSNYYQVQESEMIEFLQRQRLIFKIINEEIIIKECPFCHDLKGLTSNMWKLYIHRGTGAHFCHRCGTKGSWFDFKCKLEFGENPITAMENISSNEKNHHHYRYQQQQQQQQQQEKEQFTLHDNYQNHQGQTTKKKNTPTKQQCETFAKNLSSQEYHPTISKFLNQRHIKMDVARKYGVGCATFRFLDENYSTKKMEASPSPKDQSKDYLKNHICLTFPMTKPIVPSNHQNHQQQQQLQQQQQQQKKQNHQYYHDGDSNSNTMMSKETDKIENQIQNNGLNRNSKSVNASSDIGNDSKVNSNDINEEIMISSNYEVVRHKIRSIQDKKHMLLLPTGGEWGFFGFHLVPPDAKEIVITEGEFDAMAVYQATQIPAISLPNGCRSLPVDLLPLLERFEKIYLWMDDDIPGQQGAQIFANKLGLRRTYIVHCSSEGEEPHVMEYGDIVTKSMNKEKEMTVNQNSTSFDGIGEDECIDEEEKAGMAAAFEDLGDVAESNNFVEHKEMTKQTGEDDRSNANDEVNTRKASENSELKRAKDANEALILGYDLKALLAKAEPMKHVRIVKFNKLQQDVYREFYGTPTGFTGIQSRYLPKMNKYLKGLRRGELTILTGTTGIGKTTILSQISLDYCMQGVNTLWGSFEIKNHVLVAKMLQQMAGKDLRDMKYRSQFGHYAAKFQTLPLYLLNFYGSTNIDQVLDAMDYAVYVHDVQHIVLDNLQFMMAGQGNGVEKFDLQDRAIEKFRHFSTHKNVHISVVIHPRKIEDSSVLGLSSVFGTAKATQEADNVLIVQRGRQFRYLSIKKNRYDGMIGDIPYGFDRKSSRIYELSDKEIEEAKRGRLKLEY